MKLHDLRPAEGAHRPRTRVGRGIAAGKGKTAGRGTKGQKSRTGGTIQPWFEGGQTPIHVRLPKLRGFKNKFRIEYEVVNVGRISALAETGILDMPEPEAKTAKTGKAANAPAKAGVAPVTVTPDILAVAGLVRSLDKPLKVLGQGDVTRPLFILADAFSKSATAKIEAAGGTAQVLEFPAEAETYETEDTEGTEEANEAGTTGETVAPVAPAKKRAQAAPADAPVAPAKKRAQAAPADAPVAPAKKRATRAASAAADTLPPTSPADETGSEA
jgi:large subunit ribosomal protein L15